MHSLGGGLTNGERRLTTKKRVGVSSMESFFLFLYTILHFFQNYVRGEKKYCEKEDPWECRRTKEGPSSKQESWEKVTSKRRLHLSDGVAGHAWSE